MLRGASKEREPLRIYTRKYLLFVASVRFPVPFRYFLTPVRPLIVLTLPSFVKNVTVQKQPVETKELETIAMIFNPKLRSASDASLNSHDKPRYIQSLPLEFI
jgi:hypothetical protein